MNLHNPLIILLILSQNLKKLLLVCLKGFGVDVYFRINFVHIITIFISKRCKYIKIIILNAVFYHAENVSIDCNLLIINIFFIVLVREYFLTISDTIVRENSLC